MQCHFRGNKVLELHPGECFGPDTAGGFWRIESATYDPDTDMTTRYYLPVPQKDWPEHALIKASMELHKRQQQLLTRAMAGDRKAIDTLMRGAEFEVAK